MPVELPDLDNRTYADFMKEAMASIPALYPQWTDHNPSNPGIALVELLAWLNDMLIYRTNLIPEKNYDVFLKLIRGPTWSRPADQDMEAAIRETLREIRERYRAVSEDDYEYLTMNIWPKTTSAQSGGMDPVGRVRCLAERMINEVGVLVDAPGYVTLLVVPDSPLFGGASPSYWVDPSPALTNALKSFFDDRKLLTTRLRVSGPTAAPINIKAKLYLKDDARATILTDAKNALLQHFHPLKGGSDGRGWPWGRVVYPSDVYAVLDEQAGIDFVEDVSIGFVGYADDGRDIEPGAVALGPNELVKLDPSGIVFTLMERRGGGWIVRTV